MIEATQREGSISSIAFFTHGGDLGFYLNNDAGLFYNSSVVSPKPGAKTWDDIADAIKKGLIKFEENSTIFIDACNVGAISPSYFPGKDVSRVDALASKISRITGATVIAAVGHCEMQDQTKADGKFKISNREVEREGNETALYDWAPNGPNHAGFYKYQGGIESREDLGTEVNMDDYINKCEE